MRTKKSILWMLAVLLACMATVFFLSQAVIAGSLEPPPEAFDGSGNPASTMKTLDQMLPNWSQKLQCDEIACPRFEVVMDGAAVLDKETGLVWAKNANIVGTKTWLSGMFYCRTLNLGGRKGWRLPTVEELLTLVDKSQSNPALPVGHPFDNVQYGSEDYYWTSTSYQFYGLDNACNVKVATGEDFAPETSYPLNIWPVRGGNPTLGAYE